MGRQFGIAAARKSPVERCDGAAVVGFASPDVLHVRSSGSELALLRDDFADPLKQLASANSV